MGAFFVASGRTIADSQQPRNDADGTLHFRELAIPPSGLWSSEFSGFYTKWLAEISKLTADDPLPARTAPKSDWDKFDAWNSNLYAERLATLLKQYPVHVEDTKIAGVRVGIISPGDGIAPENRRRVLINLHGGGFVGNRGLTWGQMESIPVAAIGRMTVVTIDYRQAPFHGYPAASQDVAVVYRHLLKSHSPEAIGVFGCSAGGVLTAQTIAWLQAEGLPRPGGIGIFCAGLDPYNWVQGVGDSGMWITRASDNQCPQADSRCLSPVEWYMDGADSKDPAAYPGSSEVVLAKFPPSLFLNGTRDFTMSAALVAHSRLLKLGVDSSLYIMEGAPHAAHVLAIGTPEAHDAHAYVARWFKQHLAR